MFRTEIISLTDESKVTKTFPMEDLSKKKVLSECNEHLGHGVCFRKSVKEEECHSSNHSSDLPKENVPTKAFTFSMALSNLGSPPPVDKPILGNASYVTPNMNEEESKANCEMINQAKSPIDFSVLTAADFGITPESFKKHAGEAKSILKKLRRQSTIGVRGSPENNALIRYIARQKRMRTEDPPSQASPFQRNILLKDKIAAFQSLFEPLKEAAEEIARKPYTSKKADTKSHEQSQLDQVGPSEYKAVGFEETLNCKSSGEKKSADIQYGGGFPLEAISSAGISKTACGIESQNTNEELNSKATSQQSCKKVRFAEKQSLEIFDETKPPVTPLQKGCFPSTYDDSSRLRSVLKKTPVRMLAEDVKERLDYASTRKGSEELSDFQSCGPLQTERSSGPVDKMEAHSKDLNMEVSDALQPVDTPVRSGESSLSPPVTRNDSSFNITPVKETFSQPNFDIDDDLQETIEVVSTDESAVNSGDPEDKETKVSSPDFQATCVRATRSSAKKQVNKAEETSVSLAREMRTRRTCTTVKVPNPRKFQNVNTVTKSASKKRPASRCKAFGKRKRKKKVQKVFHRHYETVLKKPLLSPVPEMTEDISLTSSYQSTPESSVSILDRSCSSGMHETPESTNSTLHCTEEDGNCLYSNLSAVTEDTLPDTVSCLPFQLQDAVLNDTQITFPSEPPGNDSFKALNDTLNGQVPKSNYSSESEMEMGLLNLQGTGEKTSKEASLLMADSAVEQLSGGDISMNFKRLPRRSRRITLYLPNVEDFQSEIPGNNRSVSQGSTEEVPCTPQTVNNSEFLNDVLCAIEESFRSGTSSTQKRVRRSSRLFKNGGSEGLTWISLSPNDAVSQAPVGCARRVKRNSHTFCHPVSELLHQKQENLLQGLSLMTEEQKSPHAGVERCRPRKKRKSICSHCEEEN